MYKGKIEFAYLGEKELKISETEQKNCKFYSLKPLTKKKKSINHHILLLDVSGSMYGELENLKKKVNETLEALLFEGNNYASVIIYSGHSECHRIVNGVKCDKTSYEISQIYSIIEKELYTRSITVMSEPLSEAIEITKTLCNVCNKHNIVLFTDGCLVPSKWSYEEEENKCYEIADYCKSQNIFLNTIGFGPYYDRRFLNNLTNIASTGLFTHIDDINDYSLKILDFVSLAKNTEQIELDIYGQNYFLVNSSNHILGDSTINSLKPNENNLIVSFDGDIEVKGENIKNTTKKLVKGHVDDFLYSLSLFHLIKEDIDSAEITIAQTGNIDAYNEVSNCFSFLEKGKAIKSLSNYIFNKDLRNSATKGTIEVKSIENEPLCMLELIEEIMSDPKSMLLWDSSYKYKRIGLKSKSADDILKFTPSQNKYNKIVSLSIGSSKLNIGVKVEIEGCVQNAFSKLKLDCKTYKDYNIFLNGNINTPYIWCIISPKLRAKLKKEGLIIKNSKWQNKLVSTIDLTKLRATNKRILKSMTQDEVSNTLYDIELLSCKQWAINKLLEEIRENYSLSNLDSLEIHNDEKAARRAFRVSDTGVFTPSKVEKDMTSPYEVYKATYLEWRVDKFPQKKIKEDFKKKYESIINENNIEETHIRLLSSLAEVRRELRQKELKVNLVRISSALFNRDIFLWNEVYQKDKKQMDKVLNQNAIVDGISNISIKNFETFSIRQDKYEVLTKCN